MQLRISLKPNSDLSDYSRYYRHTQFPQPNAVPQWILMVHGQVLIVLF